MTQTKKKWDRLSSEQRQHCIDGVIGFFQKERNEKIGYLASEGILDCVLELVSDTIYTKGIKDTRRIIEQKLEDLKIDLDVLVE